MPRSPSPPRGPRVDGDRVRLRSRSRSPRRDRDRDREDHDRRKHDSHPPSGLKRPKELSFYKRGSQQSMGSFSHRRDPLDELPESGKERMERRERGEVPARFGGTREQGVRNTLNAPSASTQTSMGSLRRGADPLDRMPVRGGENSNGTGGNRAEQDRLARLAAMDKQGSTRTTGGEAGMTQMKPSRMIEVIANSRTGQKDTIGDLKRLIAAQTGTTSQKIQLKKWYTAFKDHVTLQDYEIHDGMSLEMY